jgi:hypothetical protein
MTDHKQRVEEAARALRLMPTLWRLTEDLAFIATAVLASSEARIAEQEARIAAWQECALHDAMMEGLAFNGSALDMCRRAALQSGEVTACSDQSPIA